MGRVFFLPSFLSSMQIVVRMGHFFANQPTEEVQFVGRSVQSSLESHIISERPSAPPQRPQWRGSTGKLTFPLLHKRASDVSAAVARKLLAEAAGNRLAPVRTTRYVPAPPSAPAPPRSCTCAWQVLQSRAVNLKLVFDALASPRYRAPFHH